MRVYATGVIANELKWDATYQTKAGSPHALPILGRDLSGVVAEVTKGHDARFAWFVVEPNREQLIQVGTLIDAGHIGPIIETVLPLSQARQAYEQGAKGHTRGKIVLRVVDE